jgi:signal peptidase I
MPPMRLLPKLPSPWGAVVETVLTLLAALAIFWVIQAFVVKPYVVPTSSMEPTLMPGDHVLADRVSMEFGNPSRYQIVVFHPPHCTAGHNDGDGVCTTPLLRYRDGAAGTTYIKRVIGVPGDVVTQRDGHIWVRHDGGKPFELHEPFVLNGNQVGGLQLRRTVVPAGYYLLLGDNRTVSDDSRAWGLEPRGDILGVARARYWPLDRLGTL